MKRLMVSLIAMAFATSLVQASIVGWESQNLTSGLTGLSGYTEAGDGNDWWVQVWNYTAGEEAYYSAANTLGWNTSVNSYIITGFDFSAFRNDVVGLRLYADAAGKNADLPYYMLESQSLTLPDIGDPPPEGSTSVNFDFGGQEWELVPEPGTMTLFGIGLLTLAAKKFRKRKE